ncbi:MAG: hypothetical protein GTN68_17230 [Candidatus Aminicenantes bacterium]|nr:hypothetical protein [Candidatus Aminicenantes bacterium]NIM80035.1 hypothetical protein [Candidatus Aminicenantes bacterium]NIO82290.1 hypothetical protein [Candidatus Aminicenantes bacterium]NIQ68158.1 hypothetical protein [Candidatus Aminicenantes bacterium]
MSLKKKLILRALTDPKFRKMLEENPEKALSAEELEELKGGVGDLLDTADGIDVISDIIQPVIFCMIHNDPPY